MCRAWLAQLKTGKVLPLRKQTKPNLKSNVKPFVFQLLKLPYTAEAAHSHLSPLIQRLTRLMAVEHQVCKLQLHVDQF